MGNLREAIRSFRASLSDNSDTIGTVVGRKLINGPSQNIVDIISSGVGDCATEDSIRDYTGYPMSVNEPYINSLIDKNVVERRQITRPKTGEVVNLFCITEKGKSPVR